MLHFLPETDFTPAAEPYAEAIARLASIRHALRLVEPFGAGPAPDLDANEMQVAAAWPTAPDSRKRCFDTRSARTALAAAAGIETLLDERQAGRAPHQAASAALVEEIRIELASLSAMMLGD